MVRKSVANKTKITISQGGKKTVVGVPSHQLKPELKGTQLKSLLWG